LLAKGRAQRSNPAAQFELSRARRLSGEQIRKWTPNVEVLNPPELRETFQKHAAKEYARYH
jgi:hypothetical protein